MVKGASLLSLTYTYYRSEQYAGLSYVLLALLNTSVVALLRYSEKRLGSIIVTLTLFALLQTVVGIYAYHDARRKQKRKKQLVTEDPASFAADEQWKLANIKLTFQRIILVFAAIIVLAFIVLTYGYWQDMPRLIGPSWFVIIELSLMIVSDLLAKRRLTRYHQQVANWLSAFFVSSQN